MRWGIFAVAVFVTIVADVALSGLFEIRVPSLGGVRPSLASILALYVSMWAPRTIALWACFLIGALVDLTTPIAYPPAETAHLLGPHALGFAFACALALQVRSMVMRRQVFATAVLCGVYALASAIVVTAVFTVRSWLPFAVEFDQFAPAGDLVRRALVAVYTALAALPLAWLLLRTQPAWGFPGTAATSVSWR